MEIKKIWLAKNGGPASLELKSETKTFTLNASEVLIEVAYSGINFADIMMTFGFYKDAPPKPYVPGYEVAGRVLKVGENVSRIKVGDTVVAGSLFGGYASHIVTSEDLVFPVPPHLSLREAACLPVNWITAYAALYDMGRLRQGDRVLVDAATGGVGTMALQMVTYEKAHAVGLTSSPAKKSYVESLAATALTHEEFARSVEPPFDIILNSQGGKTVTEQYERLSSGGRIIAFGVSSGVASGPFRIFQLLKTVIQMPRFSLLKMFDKNRGVHGLNVLKLLADSHYRKTLVEKWESVERMKLKPHVDRIFPAAMVAQAHTALLEKSVKGKVLLSWTQNEKL